MSLKGQRASKKSREQARRRYAIIHAVGYHNQTPNKPFHVPWKLFIVLGIILGSIFLPSYIYYSTVYVPSIPSPSARQDPFTTLWNGQVPSSFSSGPQTLGYGAAAASGNCGGGCIISGGGSAMFGAVGQTIRAPFAGTLTSFGVYQGAPANVVTKVLVAVFPSGQTPSTTCSGTIFGCDPQTNGAQTFTLKDVEAISSVSTNTFLTIALASPVTVTANQWIAIGFFTSTQVANPANGIGQCNSGCGGSANNAVLQDTCINYVSATPTVGNTFSSVTGSLQCPQGIPTFLIASGTFTQASGVNTCLGSGFLCTHANVTGGNVFLNPNSTTSAVAISTSAIDLSTGASKALAFSEQTNIFSGFGSGGIQLFAGEEYGWFLRLNSTLPDNNSTFTSYNPLTDNSVVLAVNAFVRANSNVTYYVYMQRQVGQSLQVQGTDDPFPQCPQTTLFICNFSKADASHTFLMSLVLNFTGGATGAGGTSGNGQSYLCIGQTGGSTCTVGGVNNQAISYAAVTEAFNFTQPWLNLQNNYYLGFWSNPNANSNSVKFLTSNSNPQNNVVSVYTTQGPGTNSDTSFTGWLGRSLGGAWNAAAGALSPITTPLFSLGNSLLSTFASALIQAGNLLIKGLGLLAGLIVVTLNVIGNALGLGNIGNDIATLLTNFQTFFTNQLPTAFSNLGTLFSQWFQSLTILFAWVPIALSIAANLLTIGINAISFLLLVVQDLFLLWDTMIVLMLLLFWFADIGEYGLSGFHVWFETMKYLVFGLGVGPLLDTIHYGTDIILLMVGIIPKPIIQIAAKFDTIIPSIHISGSPTWPSFTMEEVRKGNYFSVGGFLIGVIVLVWFETTSLPGSITALVPGVGVSLTRLAGVPNLLLIFLEIFGFMALFILPAQLFQSMGLGLSTAALGNLQFRRGPGVQVGSVGVSVSRREPGRILQRAEKKIGTNLNAPKGNVSEKKMEQLTKQLGSENIN